MSTDTLKKSISASCTAHAVLEWTIVNARSLLQSKEDLLDSGDLSFSEAGFSASPLGWNLLLVLDNDPWGSEGGDPKEIALFLDLHDAENVERYSEVQASYILQVFLPKTGVWESTSETKNEDFWAGDRASKNPLIIPHAKLFKEDSEYISDDDTITFRGIVDFKIASTQVWRLAAGVCSRLADLYKYDDGGNVELTSSDGKAFFVQRSILAAHSSVFREMFKNNTKHHETERTLIKGIDGKTLDILLKFIYSGHILDVKDTAEQILIAADKFKVSDLRDVAENYLCEGGITLENAYRLFRWADRRNLPKLSAVVSGFTAENWSALSQTPDFLKLKAKNGHLYAVLNAACDRNKPKIGNP